MILLGLKYDQEPVAFLLENSCLESSTLILKTLNLQNSSITLLLTSHKHRAQAYKQAKQTRTTKNGYSKQKKSFKRVYKRIGLAATVTRTKGTQEMELGLKRNNYRKIYIIKEIKEL
jgi:hypothetical protein